MKQSQCSVNDVVRVLDHAIWSGNGHTAAPESIESSNSADMRLFSVKTLQETKSINEIWMSPDSMLPAITDDSRHSLIEEYDCSEQVTLVGSEWSERCFSVYSTARPNAPVSSPGTRRLPAVIHRFQINKDAVNEVEKSHSAYLLNGSGYAKFKAHIALLEDTITIAGSDPQVTGCIVLVKRSERIRTDVGKPDSGVFDALKKLATDGITK